MPPRPQRPSPVRAVRRLAGPSARPLALALLAAALGCGGAGGPVQFGMAGPFTQGFGTANRRGAELAVAEINAAGGIGGDSLSLRFEDDSGDGTRAAMLAQGFVDDAAISAVVGHVTSGAMLAAAKVYDGHLPAIATTASSADLTGISPWAFRVISSDSANGVDLARFAERLGKKRAAILYENDSYGRGLADAFRRSFGGEVISLDPIDYDGARSALHLEWLQPRAPDLIFVAGTEQTGMAILREAKRRKLTADLLGGDGWTGVVADAAAAEGAYVGAPFTALDPRPEAQRFVQAYTARFGEEPDGNAALAYDAVKLLAAAVEAVGRDRTRIRDWLAQRAERGAFPGVTGPIAFDANGDPVGKSFTMTRIAAGRLTVAEGGR
ncbi:MAG: ABC transporter substrate-binding protein [Gemmatimonadaceae bacterium]|nr:ABC transporter substrate-binding protein [Gemmatimonadaceae bacterium]